MAYLNLVRSSLEYAASAWDPYLIKDITAIEKNLETSSSLGDIKL